VHWIVYFANVVLQNTCHGRIAIDIRGTLAILDRGCRNVSNCTTDMYDSSDDFCPYYHQEIECITCNDLPSSCNEPQGECWEL